MPDHEQSMGSQVQRNT